MGERKAKWQNDYISRSYDRVNMFLPKGQKDVVKAAAAARGLSLNAYIVAALAAFGAFDGAGAGPGSAAGAPGVDASGDRSGDASGAAAPGVPGDG